METIANCASIAFLGLVMHPAWEYASEEAAIVTPALEISNVMRAAAIPVGIGLMLVVALLRLVRIGRPRDVALALVGTAAVVAAFWLAGPLLAQAGKFNLVIFFVGIVAATVFSGVPIAFSFALATFGYLALTTTTPTKKISRLY